ncbi:ATP-binding protein [Jatrophihabitans endophyticus]|uniref:ATP-binding protein n=1 Tax=Jatrophihabitans endophyticus TaxID=1206085 RepID=UPI0019E39F34|nr:ATP-binding protein [Jatrophihabitans endophyticus]MBE7188933.1 ATP-binding protein [Jatrophihabitans endophyticus]
MSGPSDPGVVLELPSDLDAPATARRFVSDHASHLPVELVRDAELLVSEIVTNAIRHGRPSVTLQLRLDPPGIGVAVHDHGEYESMPAGDTPVPDVAQPGGRGLLIVRTVATEWGVVASDPPPGKTVWFRLQP